MANLAQFLDQLKTPAHPSSRGRWTHGSATVMRPPQPVQVWQTLVQAGELPGNASTARDSAPYSRFDLPHRGLPESTLQFHWREDFGWHRGLRATDLSTDTFVEAAPKAAATLQQSTLQQPGAGQDQLRELLAEAAHDIRSPIAVAQQILALLWQRVQAGEKLTDSECELLRQANLRLTQANQWAEGILLDRRLEHGHPINVRRRFYPHQWLTEIQPLLRTLADQRQVQVEWRGWDRSLPRLYLDPNHLSRIVMNLVTNALQASPPTSCVRISVAWLTNVTQQLVLTIEDEGRGLPRNLLHKINSTAAWPTTSEDPYGGGLGLKTAKTLAHGLGGSLTAQASHGGGTQFSLCLPVDNCHSLVRSWLKRNAEQASEEYRALPHHISIHAVRSPGFQSGSEPTENAVLTNQLDTQLQQAAGQADLVYRVAKDRWLWLSVAPEGLTAQPPLADYLTVAATPHVVQPQIPSCHPLQLPRLQGATPYRHQQVFRLANLKYADWLGAASSQHNLLSVTSVVANKLTGLIGARIPPIDELETTAASGLLWSATQPKARQVRQDTAQGLRTPFSKFGVQPSPSLADTPCEDFSGTLAELSHQWHVRQRQLDHLHTSLELTSRLQRL